MCLLNDNLSGSFILINFAIVAVSHDYVAVTNSMNFVNSLFLTDLIESREQFREERDNLSLVLYVIAELCESNHVCEEQSLIFELVHLSLFIFYNVQNVEWNQLGDED